MSQLQTRQCIWVGCNKQIKLDTSLEKSKIGQGLGITVSGWCPLHITAYNIYHKMERVRFGEVTSKIYREHKKEMVLMMQEAERLALANGSES